MRRNLRIAGVGVCGATLAVVLAVSLMAVSRSADREAARAGHGSARAAYSPGRVSPGLGTWTARAANRYWTAARMRDDTGEKDGGAAGGTTGLRQRSGTTAGSAEFLGVPTVGRLLMTGTDVGDQGVSDDTGECTASVVDSPGRNLIVTAAHCLDDAERHGHYAFVPQYHDGQKPFGAFPVNLRRAWIDPRYVSLGHDAGARFDVGFVEVGPGLDGRNVQNVVGANTMSFDAGFTHAVQLIGYTFGEARARGCTGRSARFTDPAGAIPGAFLRIGCAGYSDGTSGSPWLTGFNGRTGAVVGVIGGWHTGGDDPDTSFSAYLGPDARTLYAHARTGSTPVPLPH